MSENNDFFVSFMRDVCIEEICETEKYPHLHRHNVRISFDQEHKTLKNILTVTFSGIHADESFSIEEHETLPVKELAATLLEKANEKAGNILGLS